MAEVTLDAKIRIKASTELKDLVATIPDLPEELALDLAKDKLTSDGLKIIKNKLTSENRKVIKGLNQGFGSITF